MLLLLEVGLVKFPELVSFNSKAALSELTIPFLFQSSLSEQLCSPNIRHKENRSEERRVGKEC